MLTPLKQFICDTCDEIIESPEDGWIEWIAEYNSDTKKLEIHSFNIVHHHSKSPLANLENEGCYQHFAKHGRKNRHLHQFIDENYIMANLLKMLDIGPFHNPKYEGPNIIDMRQYVETVRRLTISHYEEAKQYWDRAIEDGYFNDKNETFIYGVENLKGMIEKYSEL